MRLVGNFYKPKDAQYALLNAKNGDLGYLKWCPGNRHDGHAHTVYLSTKREPNGISVGYIDRNQAARLHHYIRYVLAIGNYSKEDNVACIITNDNPGKYIEIEILGIVNSDDLKLFLDKKG